MAAVGSTADVSGTEPAGAATDTTKGPAGKAPMCHMSGVTACLSLLLGVGAMALVMGVLSALSAALRWFRRTVNLLRTAR